MIPRATYSVSALLLALTGCSSSTSDSGAAPNAQHGTTKTPGDTATPDAMAPPAKVEMNGKCPTNTGFAGDELCLAPPDPSEGFQLHYGPSDYDDPAEVAKFTLKPGEESNDCFFQKSSNTEDAYYSGFDFQMRPGSHHLIGQSREAPVPDGFAPCQGTDGNPNGLFAGSMSPVLDARTDPAAENQGIGRAVPANKQAVINFHVINTTAKNTLREAWLNYYYIKESELKAQRGAVDLNGGLGFNITPGTHKTYQYSCSPSVAVRVLNLTAHMHAHANRMTIWKVAGKEKSKVLEDYSWADPQTLMFDSAHTNAPADPDTATAGGDVSGDLIVQPTEAIQWECDINNDSNITLTFRNEVFTGEMCLVAGTAVSADDPSKLADFVCTRN
jgi:hypothetical protein